MNNFKELQRQQEEQYEESLLGIQKKIDSNLGTIGVFTKILDVYCSKVMTYFVSLSGGEEENLNKDKEL